jgi:uncharacterized protein
VSTRSSKRSTSHRCCACAPGRCASAASCSTRIWARWRAICGCSATLYRNDYSDAELARVAHDERRILLTRDVGLLKRSLVTRGCFLRETAPLRQLHEIVRRLDLQRQIKPFRRCIKCNGLVARIDRRRLAGVVDARILGRHTEFRRCRSCGQIYWPGTHHAQMTKIVTAASAAAQG